MKADRGGAAKTSVRKRKKRIAQMDNTELYSFIEGTVIDTFLQLARVNLMTGECQYLKQDPDIKNNFNGAADIYTQIKMLASEEYVYPEFREEFLKFSDPEYVRSAVFGGERVIVYRYKRKTPSGGRWVIFSITSPENCSPEDPWVVFGLRDSDHASNALTDAMSALSAIYYKILKINLTDDTFEVIKAVEHEQPDEGIFSITQWLREFAEKGNVHEEDMQIYGKFTEPERIKEHFRKSRARLSCRYRRRHIEGGFRWAQMDLLPGVDYSDSNVSLLLFVKDVHNEHMAELRHRQELVDNFNRDALTLLYNRHKFNDDLEELNNKMPKLVTCLYIDANGLHELNNMLGHQKGDDMLCCIADTLKICFPEERMYRIGGDEFVMMSRKLTEADVERIVAEFRKLIAENQYTVSAGISSGGAENSVYKIVGAAELAMRKDKELFYKNNSASGRIRSANDELEKLLAEKRDAEYFLKLIAIRYAGVYFVDMERDTLRYIYIPEYFKNILERSSFSFKAAMQLYAKKYVKAEYYDEFVSLLDKNTVAQRLQDSEMLTLTYQKVNGTEMRLNIIKTEERDQERNETVWIFSSSENERI